MIRALAASLLLATSVSAHAQCVRTFATPPHVTMDGFVQWTAAADFDGDSRPDVAVANVNRVTLLLNTPAGFVKGTTATMPSAVIRLFKTDVNHDGRTDLIVAGLNYLATLISDGNGNFANTTTAFGFETLLSYPRVTMGDFNGDGRDDIAIAANRSPGGVIRTFLALSDDTFSELPTVVTLAPRRPTAIFATDTDNDGKVDLAVSDNTAQFILPGNGNGTFGTQRTLVASATAATTIIGGDFDGDHRDDLIFGSSRIWLSRDNYTQLHYSFFAAASLVVDLDGDGKLDIVGGPLTYLGKGDGSFTNVSGGPVIGNAGPDAADFNGDGKLDVVSGGYPNEVAFRYGRGGGILDGGGSVVDAVDRLYPALVGDVTGDGRADVIAVGLGRTTIFSGGADGTLSQKIRFPSPDGETASLGDFNGDGKLDIVYGNGAVFLGAGDGTFPTTFPVSSQWATASAVGDLNGDGKLDAAFLNSGIRRWINDGSGKLVAEETKFGADTLGVLAVADFNRDGKADFVASDAKTQVLQYFDGTNVSTAIKLADHIQRYVVAADIDRDGNQDILAFSDTTDALLFFGGNGNGTFRSPQSIVILSGVDGRLTVADFTNDGRPDLFVSYYESAASALYVQQQDGSFVEQQRLPYGGAFSKAGDFDGDGVLDLLINQDRVLSMHLNKCEGADVPTRKRSVRH